jgi:hypothetical protein
VIQTMKGPKDVYDTYTRAAVHLGARILKSPSMVALYSKYTRSVTFENLQQDLVPGDPNWAEYPKSLVQSRDSTEYKVRRA